jgi:hypothetical protein
MDSWAGLNAGPRSRAKPLLNSKRPSGRGLVGCGWLESTEVLNLGSESYLAKWKKKCRYFRLNEDIHKFSYRIGEGRFIRQLRKDAGW